MHSHNFELWAAALVIAVIGAVYLSIVSYTSLPAASSLVGHGLGIVGFILMLMTEILYSLRKRFQFARWGKLQSWLSFHIFTGLVGPFLVFLHTSWKFQGLAGVLTLMTLIVVASGFVGRYFYTAIPRTSDGIILETIQIQELIEVKQLEISSWQQNRYSGQPADGQSTSAVGPGQVQAGDVLLDPEWSSGEAEHVMPLSKLLAQQIKLKKQLSSLERTRKLLAIWHTVHIPLGLSLFLAAFVHIFAALYYSIPLH